MSSATADQCMAVLTTPRRSIAGWRGLHRTAAVCGWELRGFFLRPSTYVLLLVLSLLATASFSWLVTLMARGGGVALRLGDDPAVQFLGPNVFVVGALTVLIPLLSMPLIADERRRGTWDLLLVTGVRPGELLLGKLVAGLAELLFAMSPWLVYALVLWTWTHALGLSPSSRVSPIDLGATVCGWFGLCLIGLTFMSIGVACSSCCRSATGAAGLTLSALLLGLADSLAPRALTQWGVSGELVLLIRGLGCWEHQELFSQGKVVPSIVAGHLAVMVIALWVAARFLSEERFAGGGLRSWRELVRTTCRRTVPASVAGVFSMFSRCLLAAALLAAPWVAGAVFPAMVDLTNQRVHTLAPQTRNLLRGLRQPLELTMIVRRDSRTVGEQQFEQVGEMFRELAELIRYEHPELRFAVVDPEADADGRELQRRFPDASAPCVLVRAGGEGHAVLSLHDLVVVRRSGANVQSVDFLAEQALTAALLRLTGQRQQAVVYATTGHGEMRLEGTGPNSLRQLIERLELQGFNVHPWDLSAGPIPADARLLLVAGPQQPFSTEEAQRMETWLAHGGSAIWLFDLSTNPAGGVMPTGLENSLRRFGIALGADRVVTRGFTGPLNAASPGIPAGGDHALLDALPTTPVTLYECRSVRVQQSVRPAEGLVTPLLVSHPAPRAWAEGDLESAQPASATPGGIHDLDGPVCMAVAVESRDRQPMLVVVGDAEFIGNRALSLPEGRSGFIFLQSALHWLRGRPELLGDIPPRRHEPYVLAGTPQQHRQLVWIPCAIFAAFATTGGIVSALRLRG